MRGAAVSLLAQPRLKPGLLASAAIEFVLDAVVRGLSKTRVYAACLIREHAKTPRFGHACEIETSVLMELAPELVRREALAAGDMLPNTMKLAFNNQPFALQTSVPFDQQTRNGAFGDARLADPAIGKDIVETALERTVAFVETFVRKRG